MHACCLAVEGARSCSRHPVDALKHVVGLVGLPGGWERLYAQSTDAMLAKHGQGPVKLKGATTMCGYSFLHEPCGECKIPRCICFFVQAGGCAGLSWCGVEVFEKINNLHGRSYATDSKACTGGCTQDLVL
eukprot:359472-Chlamydomonas_euryale.AAC.5